MKPFERSPSRLIIFNEHRKILYAFADLDITILKTIPLTLALVDFFKNLVLKAWKCQ